MKILIISMILLTTCGQSASREGQPTTSYSPSPELQSRYDFYLGAVNPTQDSHGFVDTDHCDSLLHSALLGAGGATISLSAAREESGRWLRRPVDLSECLASGSSKSTISRDMLMGVFWYAWSTKDLDMLSRLWNYGDTHGWQMGDHDGSLDGISRVFLSPNLIALLAAEIYALGGPDYAIRNLPVQYSSTASGFALHLDLLDFILWKQILGYYSPKQWSVLQIYSTRWPDNALLQYALGNKADAERLILRDHPEDRLPTSADMCSPMAYERDSLAPCPAEGRTHAPIHFLLLAKLLLQHNKEGGD